MKTKTTTITKFATCLALGLTLTTLKAQEAPPKVDIRKAGFGMKFSLLGIEDLGISSSITGGKAFFVSVNPTKYLRIEPEFGFTTSVNRNPDTGNDQLSKGSHYGASAYCMFQQGNTNFYFGPTFQMQKISTEGDQVVAYSSTGSPIYKTVGTEGKGTSAGIIAGAEYFFNRHFSLGMELGYLSHKYNPDISKPNESRSSYTTGNLTLRAYF